MSLLDLESTLNFVDPIDQMEGEEEEDVDIKTCLLSSETEETVPGTSCKLEFEVETNRNEGLSEISSNTGELECHPVSTESNLVNAATADYLHKQANEIEQIKLEAGTEETWPESEEYNKPKTMINPSYPADTDCIDETYNKVICKSETGENYISLTYIPNNVNTNCQEFVSNNDVDVEENSITESVDQINKIDNESTQQLAEAWSEPACIICNIDLDLNEQEKEKPSARVKEETKLKNFFIEVMAVGQDIRLEDEDFFPFCAGCMQELSQLMGIGYKIDFMHRQFDNARDIMATKCVKTFLKRTRPELLDDNKEESSPHILEKRKKVSSRECLLEGWKRRYEVVQPGPKNPVMIRSMDSRGRVTVVRINSKGEAVLPPERYPKRGGVDAEMLKNWEEEQDDDDEQSEPLNSSTNVKVYNCPQCQKFFHSKSMLAYHSRIHSGELPFECEICGKAFAVPHYLITHMRVHSGEKPYKCEICSKGFSQRGGLAIHSLVHSGEKPFECNICGKAFRQKYHLTQHRLIHSGAKPFPCELCHKSFNVKMNLREHMRRHTGDRPYKCPYCTVVGYFRKKMLRDHITRTHPQRALPEELLEPGGLDLSLEYNVPPDGNNVKDIIVENESEDVVIPK